MARLQVQNIAEKGPDMPEKTEKRIRFPVDLHTEEQRDELEKARRHEGDSSITAFMRRVSLAAARKINE